jgi:DNA polymerase (family 10)
MDPMRNADVARLLDQISRLMEIKGDNRFKIQAFADGARRIANWPEAVEDLYRQGRLREIPGVGVGLERTIGEYLEQGHSSQLETLTAEFPPELLDLEEIPGVGPKLALTLYRELDIRSVDALEQAIQDGRLQKLPRLGEKSARNILQGIQAVRSRSGRTLLGVARPLAESMVAELQSCPAVEAIEICGSLRRWRETIGDLDLLVSSTREEEVMDAFASLPQVRQVLLRGSTKTSVQVEGGLQVDLRVVPRQCFGAALQYFTGSQVHNIRLRELAIRKGLKLNEYGLFRLEDDICVAGEREEEVYEALGMAWVPPELREDQGEVEASLANRLPRLVELADIRGDLHVHSDWSDGSDSAQVMLEKARSLGYQYLAFCDHGEVLGVARGLSLERFRSQRKALRSLSRETGFPLLCGVEANILSDGTLDFKAERFKAFDWVVAGIHTGFSANSPPGGLHQSPLGASAGGAGTVQSGPDRSLPSRRPNR